MEINRRICELINYGLNTGLIRREDKIYTINRLLEVFELEEFEEEEVGQRPELEMILKGLIDDALEMKIITSNDIVTRDLFDTKIMGCLVPRPGEIIDKFKAFYQISPEQATKYYYKLSQDSDYIRRYRIERDMKWIVATNYGNLDITINLSKPEKDPKAIAAALKAKQSTYPKCLLCKENEGYAGRGNHPARQNHRIIPIELGNQQWYFQYSPYVYYNEHCIVLNGEHIPMRIDRGTFVKLLGFVRLFPHYFVGSNADLPIVGGSILTHDHFQGGHYEFPMAKAPIEERVSIKGYERLEAGIVKWPMSVLRIRSEAEAPLVNAAEHILNIWRQYTDKDAFIFSHTDDVPHNTITPIARFRAGKFEMDLVLRNNITTKAFPDGLYHPHKEHHHIKKENIGLIEVMGLAVLPARLKEEIEQVKDYILSGADSILPDCIEKHGNWIQRILKDYQSINASNIDVILQNEIGKVYAEILEQTGVFKRSSEGKAAFARFIKAFGTLIGGE